MDKHQLAGLDARERGFSRPIEFEQVEGGVRAILRYETMRVVTDAQESPRVALEELIRALQKQGYSQLRSQLTVRNEAYLGSQEPWIEYPNPERQPERTVGWLGRVLRCFRRLPEDRHG